jgi:hypothetical protein
MFDTVKAVDQGTNCGRSVTFLALSHLRSSGLKHAVVRELSLSLDIVVRERDYAENWRNCGEPEELCRSAVAAINPQICTSHERRRIAEQEYSWSDKILRLQDEHCQQLTFDPPCLFILTTPNRFRSAPRIQVSSISGFSLSN